jgi:TP901 family phage tail tape measure protein
MAVDSRLTLEINAVDATGSAFASVMNRMRGIDRSAATSMYATSRVVQQATQQWNSSFSWFNRAVVRGLQVAGRAVISFTQDSIKAYAEIEQQHAKTMGALRPGYEKSAAGEAQFQQDSKRLREQAIQLGTYGPNGKGALFNPTEVSQAQTALVKAGMDEKTVEKVAPTVLQFAGGNDMDIETATRGLVNMSTIFGIKADDWGDMADKINRAADISVIDTAEIFQSAARGGGIFGSMGRDLTEFLGVISTLGQAGLRGGMGGTAAQALLVRGLGSTSGGIAMAGKGPTEKSQEAFEKFQNSVVDENGKFRGIINEAELFEGLASDLSDEESTWLYKKVLGMFQIRSGYAITNGEDGEPLTLENMINDIKSNSGGSVGQKYQYMLDSGWGVLESLSNLWQGTKVGFGEDISPMTNQVAKNLFDFLDTTDTSDPNWINTAYENLQTARQQTTSNVRETYGDNAGNLIDSLLGTGIDVGSAIGIAGPDLASALGGQFSDIVGKIGSGDVIGAVMGLFDDSDWNTAKEDIKEKTKDLDPAIQDAVNAFLELADTIRTLVKVNLAMKLAQLISSIGLASGAVANVGRSIANIVTGGSRVVGGTSAVGTMRVSAGVVYVNGAVAGGGGTTTTGGGGNKSTVPLNQRTTSSGKPISQANITNGPKSGASIKSAKPGVTGNTSSFTPRTPQLRSTGGTLGGGKGAGVIGLGFAAYGLIDSIVNHDTNKAIAEENKEYVKDQTKLLNATKEERKAYQNYIDYVTNGDSMIGGSMFGVPMNSIPVNKDGSAIDMETYLKLGRGEKVDGLYDSSKIDNLWGDKSWGDTIFNSGTGDIPGSINPYGIKNINKKEIPYGAFGSSTYSSKPEFKLPDNLFYNNKYTYGVPLHQQQPTQQPESKVPYRTPSIEDVLNSFKNYGLPTLPTPATTPVPGQGTNQDIASALSSAMTPTEGAITSAAGSMQNAAGAIAALNIPAPIVNVNVNVDKNDKVTTTKNVGSTYSGSKP